MGNFNVLAFNKNIDMLFSKTQSKFFDSNYVISEKSITVTEPNGVGTVTYKYYLPLKDFPKDISSVSIVFDSKKTSVGNISLKVTDEEKTNYFSVSNVEANHTSSIISIGTKNINELALISEYDSYGGSSISNEEIVSVLSVRVNDADDIALLKKQALYDLIKSLVISALIWLIGMLIVKSSIDKKLFKNKFCVEKVFLVASLIVGVLFSFMFPVYQVPDEQTHINMLYDELNWDINIKDDSVTADFADTLRIIRNYDQKVNVSTYFNSEAKAKLPSSIALPSLTVIRHLPQAVGLVLASIIRLPLWSVVIFAEIFAAIAYSILGYFAIKILPLKKELMTAIMLLPICIQQFPSFCYDSFMLAAYFLFFSYILYIKFTKEKFTLLDAFILLLSLAVVAITKIPYVFVSLLVLIIPISKIDFNFGLFRLKGEFIKKHKTVFLIVTSVCFVLIFAVAIKMLLGISYGRILAGAFYNLRNSASLIVKTTKTFVEDWFVEMTGNFGWFDTPVPLVFTVFVVGNLLFLSLFDFNNNNRLPAEKNFFKIGEIILFYVVAVTMFYVVVLSMFSWTMKAYGIDAATLSISQISDYMGQIPYIGGLQGRYFVPILPLLLMPYYFPKLSESLRKTNHITYLCAYHLTVYAYMFVVVLKRYWL